MGQNNQHEKVGEHNGFAEPTPYLWTKVICSSVEQMQRLERHSHNRVFEIDRLTEIIENAIVPIGNFPVPLQAMQQFARMLCVKALVGLVTLHGHTCAYAILRCGGAFAFVLSVGS